MDFYKILDRMPYRLDPKERCDATPLGIEGLSSLVWYAGKAAGTSVDLPNAIDNSRWPHARIARSTPRVREVVIAQYLLNGTQHLDVMGDKTKVSRLEGEIRRFEARRQGLNPSNVQTSVQAVEAYCQTYGLPNLEPIFMECLGLKN